MMWANAEEMEKEAKITKSKVKNYELRQQVKKLAKGSGKDKGNHEQKTWF